jgi:transforming growth factor-beta-induced protein
VNLFLVQSTKEVLVADPLSFATVCSLLCSLALATMSAAQNATAGTCSSIAKLACGTKGLETLCTAVKAAGLNGTLAGGNFTVFAPTNDAFKALPSGTLDKLLKDIPALKNILLYHVVSGKVLYSKNLKCSALVKMANGKNTRTVCQSKKIFQKGRGNSRSKMPQVLTPDIKACNGVVHLVSQVLLP